MWRTLAFASGRLLLSGTVGLLVGVGVFVALGLVGIIARMYGLQSMAQFALIGAAVGTVAGPVLGLLRMRGVAAAVVEGLTPALLYLITALIWLNRDSGVFQTPQAAAAYVATGVSVLLIGGGISGWLTGRLLLRMLARLDERYAKLETAGHSGHTSVAAGTRYRI